MAEQAHFRRINTFVTKEHVESKRHVYLRLPIDRSDRLNGYLNRGMTSWHQRHSEDITCACDSMLPGLISAEMPASWASSRNCMRRSVTMSGVPTMPFSRCTSA